MSFLSCCKLLLLLSLLFELTKAQTRTTNKCLVRWEVNTNEGRTGLKVLGSVSQSGINGDVTSEDFANDHSTSPSDRTSSKTFPVYGAIFSSYVPSSSTDVCNGETFKNMLPTMTALKLENSADGNETTLNMNIPQLYLPASVGLVVNSKVGFVPVKVASSRIIGLSMGVEGTTSTFTKTGANEYSFTTLENTVEMRTKSGTITVHPIVGNPAEVPFAEQKTKRLSMSGTIKYASNEFIMNIKTFEVKLSDTIKIVGNIELRASSRLECNELCTIHGKCVYLSGSTSCQCQCGWSGLDCQVPPTLSSPIYGKAVIPKELPVSGGSMSIIMNGSSANFENILSKSDVRVMIGYSPSVDAPTLLGGSGSAAFAITAPPSYGRLSNVWTNVYLGSTKNWWCHLPQSTSSKIFKYYPTESIYKLYGTCSDQSIPYLGNTLNSVKVYDQIKGGVCGSGIQCLNNGKRESKPCKCNCQDTGGWTGFDCGLCSGKSRIRKSSIDDDINATRSMCSTQVQTEKDKNNVYCDEDMGYRDNYELNLYCMPGPQLVNLTGPDLTVKVLCGAGSAGKCNVDVFFHSSVTYTTGPRRVLFCEAQKCTAKEVSVLIKTDEKGYNVSSVLQQKVVCEEATCACAPGVSECSDTIKSILKEVKGPFQLNCKGSQSLRSFSCTVDEKHLPIQLDLDCSAGTCRTERPPDLLEVESNGFILSPGAIVIIAISLGIAMCFVIACAQVEEGCFGKKQKNEKRNYTCSKIGVVDHVDGNDTVEMIAVTAFSGDDPAHDARNGGNENNSDNSKDGNEEAVVVEGNFKKELFSSVSARRTRNRQSDACMCFNNVCYSVTKQQTSICNVRKEQISPTIILNNVSGSIRQSGLTAIMGESGAGKTSLLRVLQGRATGKQRNVNMNDNENNNILTDIEMPGAGMSSGNFKGPWPEGICPFVAQDKDSEIMESLTVEEQVTFSALLRQPRRIRRRYDNNKNDNEEEHNSPVKIARRVIQVLGLDSVRDSRGGILSGGERRRVSIALEFASLDLRKSKNRTPRLFMLDEPCSGLDSSVAYTITLTLSKLAVEHNIAVAMSIHQPSSALWSCVDDLILMNHGKCLYVGPAHGSLERLKLHFNMSRLKLMILFNQFTQQPMMQ
jgi:ABC-type multidrug transport system ATPase subunit